MNILVLLGGDSRAFLEAGFAYPKHLVEVNGIPIIQRLVRCLEPLLHSGAKTIYIIRADESDRYYLGDILPLLDPSATIVMAEGETQGAACSALLATEQIQNGEALLILNGDSLITTPLDLIAADFEARELDGGIVVFDAIHPRWSYVKCDQDGYVVETAEKRPISTLATAGIYYFRSGASFVDAAMKMILKDANVGGKYYVCPSYNELILNQLRIGVFKIDRNSYFSLSTPQGVAIYEEYLRRQEASPS